MALYNHLYAKKTGGKWIMRVEDTDAVSTLCTESSSLRSDDLLYHRQGLYPELWTKLGKPLTGLVYAMTTVSII
jgi:hypothetical protein